LNFKRTERRVSHGEIIGSEQAPENETHPTMFGSELTMLIILGKHYKTLEADADLPLPVGRVCVRICVPRAASVLAKSANRRAGSIGQAASHLLSFSRACTHNLISCTLHSYLFDYLNCLSASSRIFGHLHPRYV